MAAAAAGSPSDSQPKKHDDEQNQDPNSTKLYPDLPNSPQSPGVEHEDTLLILDDDGHQSGTNFPEPILLTDDTPPVMSPTNLQRRVTTRKKAGTRKTYKRKRSTKKIQNLTDSINPIPFVPTKTLDLDMHEEVLKRLGLYDFSKIEFDRSFRTDLIVQLIVNYDSKKRGSYVNDLRVNVNRADLARALKLPAAKQDKGSSSVEEVDLDSEVFSDEAIAFIEDFVFSWMILHDESWVIPTEIVNWTRCVRDGHPEKLDFASLIWYNVEKELSQGDKLVDCYYAPHLQYLIRSQRDSLFKEGDDDNDGEENVKVDEEKEEKKDKEEKDEIEDKEEVEEKGQEDGDEKEKIEEQKEQEEEKVSTVQEQNIELTLGTEFEEIAHEEVKKDDVTMADANECKEELEEQGNFKSILGDHFLNRCHSNNLNNYEEIKVEETEDVQIEQVEDEDEEDEEEEGGGERLDEGFDMEADDSFDRDGLTDNFLQGVEAHQNPYSSHGISSMDLFGSRDGSFMSHGGPSLYNNEGKRVMDPEEDIHRLDQNNKRLKADEIWDQKQTDIGFCFEQMQQLIQKTKMIHESKERSYENLQYTQQMAMDQLQERQQVIEMIIKSKDEELEKKHAEVFRLERELYLMGDLLTGYRKALHDTRFKFSEYRKRFALPEEPLYKDAGPGGLVLSTREIEKQRLKQEEDMMKFQILAKNFEEDCVYQLELQNDRLLPLVDKLVSIENEVQKLKEIAMQPKETHEPSVELDVPEENLNLLVENESSVAPEKNQKSLDENEKIQKTPNENESSAEPEGNQKSQDKIHENEVIMESVPPDADESEIFMSMEELMALVKSRALDNGYVIATRRLKKKKGTNEVTKI
ncbi:hypothetical protein R6Q57_008678 [Mikania cordata]